MKVLIMRHGEAESYAASDEERQLTAHGINQSKQIAHWLNKTHKIQFDYVLVSPYIRAQQTWGAIEPILSACNTKVEISDELTPYGNSSSVVDFVKALGLVNQLDSVLIVSHLPLVGYLTMDFACGMTTPIFPTSAISCIGIDCHSSRGEFLWMQRP